MAKHGARKINVCSRSGISDEASQKTMRNCLAYGYEIVKSKGDAADEEFVRVAFQQASLPITDIIQGVIIIRVNLPPLVIISLRR
jgi:hypothetical protein